MHSLNAPLLYSDLITKDVPFMQHFCVFLIRGVLVCIVFVSTGLYRCALPYHIGATITIYKPALSWYQHFFIFVLNFTPFSPQFRAIQLFVATILSHRYNSRTGSGEMKVESHAFSDTQPNQAALLLNTARIQPGSQPHQWAGGNTVHLATLVSAHCAQPTTGVAGARWDPYRPSPP